MVSQVLEQPKPSVPTAPAEGLFDRQDITPDAAVQIAKARVALELLKAGYEIGGPLVLWRLTNAGFNVHDSEGFQALGLKSHREFQALAANIKPTELLAPDFLEQFSAALPAVIAQHFKDASHCETVRSRLAFAFSAQSCVMSKGKMNPKDLNAWRNYDVQNPNLIIPHFEDLKI